MKCAVKPKMEMLKKIAVLHYSPICETVIGEPEVIYPFLGSSRLAEPLNRRNVVAAFHGHAHCEFLLPKLCDWDLRGAYEPPFVCRFQIFQNSGRCCRGLVLLPSLVVYLIKTKAVPRLSLHNSMM